MMLFWKIDDSNKVIATPDVENRNGIIVFLASTDNKDHPYEFIICYYHGEDRDVLIKPREPSDPLSKEKPLAPAALYLNVNVTCYGHNKGPLELRQMYESKIHVLSYIIVSLMDMRQSTIPHGCMKGNIILIEVVTDLVRMNILQAVKKHNCLITPWQSCHLNVATMS